MGQVTYGGTFSQTHLVTLMKTAATLIRNSDRVLPPRTGLPDGIFSYQIPQCWYILERKILIFLLTIWYNLRSSVKFCGYWLYFGMVCQNFPQFWYIVSRKIWQPWPRREKKLEVISKLILLYLL
jgi:hypothetical protein